MRFKSLVLATALVTTLATAATGAMAGPRGEMPTPEQRATHMQKALQLSDEQRQQVQKIIEKGAQQRAALEKKYTMAERDKFREEARKLHETHSAEIDALLTPAQREAKAAQHMHMKHSKGMGAHGKGMGDCPAGASASTKN